MVFQFQQKANLPQSFAVLVAVL